VIASNQLLFWKLFLKIKQLERNMTCTNFLFEIFCELGLIILQELYKFSSLMKLRRLLTGIHISVDCFWRKNMSPLPPFWWNKGINSLKNGLNAATICESPYGNKQQCKIWRNFILKCRRRCVYTLLSWTDWPDENNVSPKREQRYNMSPKTTYNTRK
jgi:hypothetical protein